VAVRPRDASTGVSVVALDVALPSP
jgi:hypothetical protein